MRHSSGLPLSPKLRDYLGLDLPPPPEPPPLTGCQRLCLAVLADALHVLYTTRHLVCSCPHSPIPYWHGGTRSATRTTCPVHGFAKVGLLRRAALAWFQDRTDDGPFSFEWVCAMLPTLNAASIRDTLAAASWQGSRHTHHTQFFAHGSGKRSLIPPD